MFETHPHTRIDAIVATLRDTGAALVAGVDSREAFAAFASALGGVVRHRDSDETGLTDLTVSEERAASPGMSGFSSSPLELHTDRSTLAVPPNLVLLRCERQSELGGELRCVDGRLLYERLAAKAPDVLGWASRDDQVVYFDGDHTFTGPIFAFAPDGTIALRFRCDGRGYYRRGDAMLLERFLEHASAIETMVKLRPGETIVLHNGWWLHGRTRFVGAREVWRILADDETRFGRGFPAPQAQALAS